MRKTRLFILLFCIWFILGVLYVSWSKTKTEEIKVPSTEEFNLDPEPMGFEDSIGLDQVKRMDSLHKAGKF